ncbi:hypothetical protein PHYPSEUDO_009532 [Phytophthora pseudosyringae]|uniref:Uncharacterized protein n=1 Tax=Phytophthora pseudosyringae TaxID=221518 RepID=A0A8T1VF54_9STRA|nr:hypothetical protein PHYPSEUDO_009532 [Phytophthora pseudosyringae]
MERRDTTERSCSAISNQEAPDRWPFHVMGGPNDVFVPRGTACQAISNLLGKFVPDRGELSFGGVAYILPVLPGLAVTDIGTVAPLEIQNSEWDAGIATLCTVIAEKFGHKDVVLQPVLSKLVMCGPGGKVMNRHEPRCVATLEVQLPSEYTGGALVVCHEDGSKQARYEFDMTSGYRFAVLFSLYLPQQANAAKTTTKRMKMELARALEQFTASNGVEVRERNVESAADSEILGLMLSKSTTKKQVEVNGKEALRDVDRDRLEFLSDVNTLLSPENQVKFYLAHLRSYRKSPLNISWFSLTSEMMCSGECTSSIEKFNFLNPDNKTLEQMWNSGGSDKNWDFECCAIVMWPASADIATVLSLMGIAPALPAILAQDGISISILRRLLRDDGLGYYQFVRDICGSKQYTQLFPLCQKLLQEKDKTKFISSLSVLVRGLRWNGIGAAVIRAIECPSVESSMNRALKLTESLSSALAAQTALTLFAKTKAQSLAQQDPDALASSSCVALLWKHYHALKSQDPKLPLDIRKMFLQMDGKLLGTVVGAISKSMTLFHSQEQSTTFSAIVLKRRQWLITEAFECNKPFTWQILNSNVPYVPQIVAFLQSPNTSFEIDEFKTSSVAHFLVAQLRQCIRAPITITVAGHGQHAFVKLVKVGGEFDMRRKEVPRYMAEIGRPGSLLLHNKTLPIGNAGSVSTTSGTKRARVDEPEGIEIE